MGGRLTTPPSSASSSSTTAHRNTGNGSSTNLSHPRTHSNSSNNHSQPHRHRSSSGHHNSHGLFRNNPSNHNRHRTTSTNIDPTAAAAFNFNLLRYVGIEHESDDQSSDDDSPQARRRLQRILIALRDVPCPVCNKIIPSDSFDKHIIQCLSKPRIDYNEDTLTENKGECVICLDDLLEGQKIARLPCLCIYHKSFIENPKMCTTDIISSFTRNAYLFVSFEIGYFIFDSIDMLKKARGRQTYEYLLHHIIIIGCFGISVYYGQYIGYSVLSLFLEINSIFLHLRQLLLLWNISRRSKIFLINIILNLVTFVVFRFGIITYMSIWLIINRSNVPLVLSFIGQSGLLIMAIINISLFYRLLKSDFLSV
ncbi:unnamed protein product [Rotaria sp. Silwood2]|nr:unnamed protein product [Rotaria sp. Silwood2]